jgi:hypothetical protein
MLTAFSQASTRQTLTESNLSHPNRDSAASAVLSLAYPFKSACPSPAPDSRSTAGTTWGPESTEAAMIAHTY